MSDKRKQRAKRWLFVGLWAAGIYSTLYIVRPVCEFLKANTPFSFMINGILLFMLGAIMLTFFKKVKVQRKSTYVLLLMISAMYFVIFLWLKIPEEKLHLVEYGFLAYLVYKALEVDINPPQAYVLAFVITTLCGWGDEGIQYLLPNRYYQMKDVILNGISGGLGLFLSFVIRREQFTEQPAAKPSY